jgi:hypothetical protein
LFSDGIQRWAAFFSPSGRAIAYSSLETGKLEIFVAKWDGHVPVGRPLLVSVGGGVLPRWSRDGKRLYYQTAQEKVMVVDITEQPELRVSTPSQAWDLGALRVARAETGALLDILPDGRMLAVQRSEVEGIPTRINVVLNFPDELKQRTSAAGK